MIKLNVGSNSVILVDAGWQNVDILEMPNTIKHDARNR